MQSDEAGRGDEWLAGNGAEEPDLPLLDQASSYPQGTIQAHGALLVVSPDSLRILQASANAESLLDVRFSPNFATPIHAIPGSDVDTWIGELLRWLKAGAETTFLRTARLLRRPMQVIGHRTGQGVVLEFEDGPEREGETLIALHPRLGQFLTAIESVTDVPTLARMAARELRDITGFNRVFLCRFENARAVVVADDVDGAWPPASHVRLASPPAAPIDLMRYRITRLHLVADAGHPPSPILPNLSQVDGKPLDLSLAGLRSATGDHLQYLRQLGAAASLTVSLVVDGALWGLVVGHNRAPLRINAQVRTACDLLCQMLAMRIAAVR
ncbi:MAG: GAF domain-containing protein [Rhodospirillaceae bacterium]|nr:GAF domain-containing protein [Rhodospirillaceae bacterium]